MRHGSSILGARRIDIMKHFWSEALLLGSTAVVLGLGLAELLLPEFNRLAQTEIALSYFNRFETALFIIALVLIIGFLPGSIPALMLSRNAPTTIIKNRFRLSTANRFSSFLIMIQFAITGVLLVCTLTMLRQVDFLKNKNTGYEKANILALRTHNFAPERVVQISRYFKTDLLSYPGIVDLTAASTVDLGIGESGATIAIETGAQRLKVINLFQVEANFLDFFHIQPKLVGQHAYDSGRIFVNEALVRELGWQAPLGQTLDIRDKRYTVAGVVPDFHFESLHRAIKPAVLCVDPQKVDGTLFIKFASGEIRKTIDLLQEKWRQIAPELPFDYSFLDEALARQYQDEERWASIIRNAAFFAILVAGLGLFGLCALSISQRTKEIGVRKVLGATVANVTALLAKDFVKLVLIANVIAWPLAWLAMNQWLANFAYRIEISWWVFARAGGLALLIALVTVSTQAIKASIATPVDSLRYE